MAIEKISTELKRKQRYNTKVNNRYFKRHRLQQWGSQTMDARPVLFDDLDIMERIDLIDNIDGSMI